MKIDRDKIGVFTSGACAVHCLLLPFLIAGVPAIGSVAHAPWVHGTVFGIAFIPAIESLIIEGAAEKKWLLVTSGFLGLALMLSGLLKLSDPHEPVLSQDLIASIQEHQQFVIGGLVLGIAHLVHLYLKKVSACPACSCS